MTIVQNNETGYLLPRCPGFFAERLDALLSEPELLARMQLAARPSVLHFSWSSVADQVNHIYDDLVDELACVVAQ